MRAYVRAVQILVNAAACEGMIVTVAKGDCAQNHTVKSMSNNNKTVAQYFTHHSVACCVACSDRD